MKIVLSMAIIDRVMQSGKSFTQAELAKIAGCSTETVKNALSTLKAKYSRLIATQGHNNFYIETGFSPIPDFEDYNDKTIQELQELAGTSKEHFFEYPTDPQQEQTNFYILQSAEGYYAGKSRYSILVSKDVYDAIIIPKERVKKLLITISKCGNKHRWTPINTSNIEEVVK